MIQGTTSDAGKSDAGGRPVPHAGAPRRARGAVQAAEHGAQFSAVTVDGGEIGRAQAVQAQACGAGAAYRLQPGAAQAQHRHAAPRSSSTARRVDQPGCPAPITTTNRVAMEAVLQSWERLTRRLRLRAGRGRRQPGGDQSARPRHRQHGLRRGGGLPGDRWSRDIDRGGVFAHLVGTLALLSPVRAGAGARASSSTASAATSACSKPGLDWLEQRTGKPVLGVLPYLHGLHARCRGRPRHGAGCAKDARARCGWWRRC
ncbi:MAG: hypothetical protein MZV65_13725 [Chromatiales bacterium]|nr:hypothetical protein [Chromatiales bacterium]